MEYEAYLKSPFSFIDEIYEQHPSEFVYLNANGPYDLEIVEHKQVDPDNYYTLSKSGILHMRKGDTSFTKLDQWEREYYLFSRMMQVCVCVCLSICWIIPV